MQHPCPDRDESASAARSSPQRPACLEVTPRDTLRRLGADRPWPSVDGRTVRLRFCVDAGGALERLTVDDVSVRAEGGKPTGPPGGTLPPVTDVTAPGPYAVTVDTTAGPGGDG